MTEAVDTCLHVRLLLEYGQDQHGQPYTPTEISRQINISQQTLSRLMTGKSRNISLHTARQLCAFYGISLDYFACTDEAECLRFLSQHQHIASPLLEIERETNRLSDKGQRNVLTILQWLLRARQSQNT